MLEKLRWLRSKTTRALAASGVPPAWDAAQFLYELVGKDDGEALTATLGSVGDPGGVDLVVELLPVLAQADEREALDRESANRAFLLLAAPTAMFAWSILPPRLAAAAAGAAVPGSSGSRATLHDACVVAAHCLDLRSDAFVILPWAALAAAARAAAASSDAPGAAAALRAAAEDLDVKGAHARDSRAAAEDTAAEAAARDAVAATAARAPRVPNVSTDAQLEEFALGFRAASVLPTRDDIVIPAAGIGGGGAAAAVGVGAAAAGQPLPQGGDRGNDGDQRGIAHYMSSPALPFNRARGSFPSLNAYIATHWRLLREDSLASLREGLLAYVDRGITRGAQGSCRVYTNVRPVGVYWGRRRVGWHVRFSLPPGRKKISPRVLLTGSLLCLVPRGDDRLERIVFATVSNRDDKLLGDPFRSFIDIEEVIDDVAPDAVLPGV
jgi:hypothetical protein